MRRIDELKKEIFMRFLIVKNTGNIEDCRMRLTEYQILRDRLMNSE